MVTKKKWGGGSPPHIQDEGTHSASTAADSLSGEPATPACGSKSEDYHRDQDGAALPNVESHPLMDEAAWVALRDSVVKPDQMPALVTTEEGRREFLTGAMLLGLIDDERTAKPQQLMVADMLNAGEPLNAVLMPRRSTKTSSELAVLIGRCALRPRRNSAFTLATNGLKAREKFREEVVDPIEARYPDPKSRPLKIHKAGGGERLEFPNRSVFGVHPPLGSSFRSSAYDDVLVDEGGEADDAMTEDLLAAIPPTMDTTGGSMIVSGTAGKHRGGNLLWRLLTEDALQAAVIRYSVPDTVTDEELSGWEPSEAHPEARVRELVERHHPGVGNLTPLAAVERNYHLMPRDVFIREYLGIFADDGGSTALFDPLKWGRGGVGGDLPPMPERLALAFAAHPDQLSVSIMAAWRTPKGKAVPLLLDRVSGIDKAPALLLKWARKLNVPIVYDSGNQVNLLIVESLNRAPRRPKLEPKVFIDVKKAASNVVDIVDTEQVEHYQQPELDEAIKLTVKRKSGDRGWLLGRDPKRPDDDITPAEGWALAQLAYDTAKRRSRPKGRVSS